MDGEQMPVKEDRRDDLQEIRQMFRRQAVYNLESTQKWTGSLDVLDGDVIRSRSSGNDAGSRVLNQMEFMGQFMGKT